MLDNFIQNLPEPLQRWFMAFRMDKWGRVIGPFLLGQALGLYHSGVFSVGAFATGLLFTLASIIFIVLMNDWVDLRVDAIKRSLFPDQTKPHTIIDGIIPKEQVLNAALIAGILTLAISVVGGVMNGLGNLAFYALLCGFFFAAYTLPPIKLNYRGGGELMEMLGIGLTFPLFHIYLQGRSFYFDGFMQFIVPLMMMSLATAIAAGLPDEVSDREGGKVTIPVMFGNAIAKKVAEALLISSIVFSIVFHLLFYKFSPVIWIPANLIRIVFLYLIIMQSRKALSNDHEALVKYRSYYRLGVVISIFFAAVAIIVCKFAHIGPLPQY